LAARDKPLFETLKDLPAASLTTPSSLAATTSGNKARASLAITNGSTYARLIRVRAEWNDAGGVAPYLVTYSDNFFDLLPGQSKSIAVAMFMAEGQVKKASGNLLVEGQNTRTKRIPVELREGVGVERADKQ
jgi:hypothetical protein